MTLLIYDVKAVSGYNVYSLNGYDIINPVYLYNAACNAKISSVDTKLFHNTYDTKDFFSLELYHGASSDMYIAMYLPRNINAFTNKIYDRTKAHWIKYTF